MSETTITRRRAIGAGTLFLGAGLLGTTTTPAVAAESATATAPVLGTVADMSTLVAESKAASEKINEADEAAVKLGKRLREELSPEQFDLHLAHDTAMFTMYQAEEAWLVAEIARHFPGISPAIYAIADHILGDGQPTGTCCMDDGAS